MLRLISQKKWRLAPCALVLLLAQKPCYAQKSVEATNEPATATNPEIPPAIARELEAMRKRIEQLEAQLAEKKAQEQPAMVSAAFPVRAAEPAREAAPAAEIEPPKIAAVEKKPPKAERFVFAVFTWLKGNRREKTPPLDTKFFTPEIRVDVDYIYDFHNPKDDTISGSSEVFRSSEVQLTQLGVGGDFHFDNVRGRLMTQFGMYSATTPRNDPSPSHGQWDLVSAYRYLSEAYGGYHFDKLHGINVDAGIFLSYIG